LERSWDASPMAKPIPPRSGERRCEKTMGSASDQITKPTQMVATNVEKKMNFIRGGALSPKTRNTRNFRF